MKYDYSKLNGRITEICGTQAIFAKKMKRSERCISNKLQQKVPFKQPEIDDAIIVLNLTKDDIPSYFFKIKVQNF